MTNQLEILIDGKCVDNGDDLGVLDYQIQLYTGS